MDMRCVKCGHDRVVKHGSVHGMPTHQCKACGSQFTKPTVHDDQKYPLRIKLLAVWLSISGVSRRRLSRLCQCSTPSVRNWVRDDARKHDEKPSPEGRAVILEVDDMWHDFKKSPENPGSGKL
jgi:transposase